MTALQLHSSLQTTKTMFLPLPGAFCVLSVLGQPGAIMAANLDYGIRSAAEPLVWCVLQQRRIFHAQRSRNLHGCSSCVWCMGTRAVH
jgi:hypothetical protein